MQRFVVVCKHALCGILMIFSSNEAFSRVQVFCRSGQCYYGKFGSSVHRPIKAAKSLELSMEDRVIGIGEGTHIEIIFADQSRVHMRDTSFFRIQEGNKQLILSQGRSAPDAPAQQGDAEIAQENANLVYIGDHPVLFVVPRAGEPIVLNSFPDNLSVVFRSPAGSRLDPTLLKKWSLFQVDDQNFVADVEFVLDELDFWRAQIEFTSQGNYLLIPYSERIKGNATGLKLHIRDGEDIEGIISDLLNNADTFKDAGIEVRGNSK